MLFHVPIVFVVDVIRSSFTGQVSVCVHIAVDVNMYSSKPGHCRVVLFRYLGHQEKILSLQCRCLTKVTSRLVRQHKS
jgi:hypothetical protein